jgi:hypothetical protein
MKLLECGIGFLLVFILGLFIAIAKISLDVVRLMDKIDKIDKAYKDQD